MGEGIEMEKNRLIFGWILCCVLLSACSEEIFPEKSSNELAALGHLREFQTMLDRRRNLICERLDEVPHIFSYVRPEGAYYVFPKIRIEHQNSVQFALDLLKDARVCVSPGAAFGPMGEGHVRMAFCGPEDEIDKAFDRIERHFPS